MMVVLGTMLSGKSPRKSAKPQMGLWDPREKGALGKKVLERGRLKCEARLRGHR